MCGRYTLTAASVTRRDPKIRHEGGIGHEDRCCHSDQPRICVDAPPWQRSRSGGARRYDVGSYAHDGLADDVGHGPLLDLVAHPDVARHPVADQAASEVSLSLSSPYLSSRT